MPDIVKEIYNATIPLSSFASGTLGLATVVTTNASTQFVLKDVSNTLGATLPASPSLEINGTTVISDLRTGLFTGSEIVDVNSTLSLRIVPTDYVVEIAELTRGVYNNFSYYPAAQSVYRFTKNKVDITYPVAGVSGIGITTSIMVGSGVIGADFFYAYNDGNSNWNLYKRAGGVSGAETIVTKNGNINYGWPVFDGVSKWYVLGIDNILQVFDNSGSTWVNTTYTGQIAPTSYARAAFANGIFWYIAGNGYAAVIYGIRVSDGVKFTINVSQNFAANPGVSLSVNYLVSGANNYYAFCCGNGGAAINVFIVINLPSAANTVTAILDASTTAYPAPGLVYYDRIRYNFLTVGMYLLRADGGLWTQSMGSTVPTFPSFSNQFRDVELNSYKPAEPLSVATAALYPAKYNATRLRITGVQST